ncbi:MAG: UDP-N-acetylmuramoyl-L-alanine--D-glutamate ligase [Oscillospiraceae bacterium]|nr:UDP-N-acetylmuramoyl-L-alanine--D-glutamate ligase [Oscillospiraceae bacterium]
MTLSDYIESIKDKRIGVIGIGVSNTPLIEKLAASGCNVTACDKRTETELGEDYTRLADLGVSFSLGENYLENLDFDILFRTPGLLPFDPHLEAVRERGGIVTSEMELFFALCPCKIFSVTGSDGKTTTTTIISELLRAQGYTVHIGGNIGMPLLCEVDSMKPDDMVVLELSSFQLHSMKCRPDVAVITNISPNHLDKHKDYQDYIDAKAFLFTDQGENDRLILNHENEYSAYYAGKAKSEIAYFSRACELKNGVFSDEKCIYHVKNGEKCRIMAIDDIKLPGTHNLENYMAAFAATYGFVSDAICSEVAKSFNGVEHRLERVRELNGVVFINDSIGTSPTRTKAGLMALKTKPILIAGGYDKHIPFDELGDDICLYAKKLFLTGDTAEKIAEAVRASRYYREDFPMVIMDDFKDTVLSAAESAETGDIVLLSPACAAFDRFKNFSVRGRYFKQIVMEL